MRQEWDDGVILVLERINFGSLWLCDSCRRTLIIRSWQTSVSVAHEGLATGMLGWHGTTCQTYTCTVALCPDRQLHCPAGLQEGTDNRRGCWGWHRATGCSFPLPGSLSSYHHRHLIFSRLLHTLLLGLLHTSTSHSIRSFTSIYPDCFILTSWLLTPS